MSPAIYQSITFLSYTAKVHVYVYLRIQGMDADIHLIAKRTKWRAIYFHKVLKRRPFQSEISVFIDLYAVAEAKAATITATSLDRMKYTNQDNSIVDDDKYTNGSGITLLCNEYPSYRDSNMRFTFCIF